jgi:hypothetical protein
MLIRRPLLCVAPAAIVSLAVAFLARFQAIGPDGLYLQDFVEYWAAGHLNASGQNPYDPVLMGKVEQEVRPYLGQEVMMWNPPWTLTLVMPLGILACHWAHLIWLIVSLTILLVGADWLWRFYGGILRYRAISWFIALSFTPTMLVLEMGQITPLILLGLIGFLYFQARNPKSEADTEQRGTRNHEIPKSETRAASFSHFELSSLRGPLFSDFEIRISDFFCGACLVLVAIKPHLAYLIGLAILAWAIDRRRWFILLGGVAGLLVATIIPMVTNGNVLGQYWEALSQHPPARFYSPTIGTFLRLLFGPDKFWLQFVPVFFGVVWLGWYWWRHRRDWQWSEQLPVLLLACYFTAPYGAWPFDYVVMLIPLVVIAVRVVAKPRLGIVAYAALSFLSFDLLASWQRTFSYEYHHLSIWMTPMLILMYMTLAKAPSGLEPAIEEERAQIKCATPA